MTMDPIDWDRWADDYIDTDEIEDVPPKWDFPYEDDDQRLGGNDTRDDYDAN